jgi:hypothetical protein
MSVVSQPTSAPASDAAAPTAGRAKKIVAIALCLIVTAAVLGGLWTMYDAIAGGGPTARSGVVMQPDYGYPPGGRGGLARILSGPRNNQRNADGIREVLPNNFVVRKGEAAAQVRRQNDGSWQISFGYNKPDLVPPEQRRTLRVATELLMRRTTPEQLGITAEQLQQIRALGRDPGMVVSAEQRKAFDETWAKYVAAEGPARTAQDAAVLAALEQVATASLDPTRAALADRAARIAGILTPEQIARGTDARNARN